MSDSKKKDIFAEIAGQKQILRDQMLEAPQPPQLEKRFFKSGKSDLAAAFKAAPKMSSSQELQKELHRMRANYSQFMKDFAPPIKSTRLQLKLEDFDWRKEIETDKNNFDNVLNGKGPWEQVKIPHYGGPLGRAVTYYRTTFKVTKQMLSKGALFICFKAVDYKAHIFINKAYIGSHEGAFAPFEFDFTNAAKVGENVVVIKVENDAVCLSNDSWGPDGGLYEGDKLYAATGPGYDEPVIGWHHCPPGMGIYQDVFIEASAKLHIHNIFVRPIIEQNRLEAWIEVQNCNILRKPVRLEITIFGQNFRGKVLKNHEFKIDESGPGVNYYKTSIELKSFRLWTPDKPWLYQIQIRLLDETGHLLDTARRQFGMRSFKMDEQKDPKGTFYFNGEEIRLRGANTMGAMQQCVMKKDWNQLRDDILLAKICNMNFMRLTQFPVQSEIYDYCDRLGLMTQTDLPLFGILRRNQFCQAVKQAQEMERLVRSHPCNILISYINEPFPRKHHRHLTRDELEDFFTAADKAVRIANPDRVIKPVDGDYDPPAPGLPDNHCYCGWYNGHGIDIGKLHKGHWQKIKPGWLYGCGEFGAEGLESANIMRKYYPADWLPRSADDEPTWTPDEIPRAQTNKFHYMWFDTQASMDDWVRASQQHQAWVTRLMTEAFRRDSRMNSFAIHLFIDAFPSGWMKTIMDFKRQPKPSFFEYRNALEPLMINLRTDRFSFFAAEEVDLECWVCNDHTQIPKDVFVHYQLEHDGKILFAQKQKAVIPSCSSKFQGYIRLKLPQVKERSNLTVRVGLLNKYGKVLTHNSTDITVFPKLEQVKNSRIVIIGSKTGTAAQLARQLNIQPVFTNKINPNDCILVDDFKLFQRNQKNIMNAVRNGASIVFFELPQGSYKITGKTINITPSVTGPMHFVSRKTGHPMVADFEPDDFKFWYDSKEGCITPILETMFTAKNFKPILTTRNGNWQTAGDISFAAAELKIGKGIVRICQLKLVNRYNTNPAAKIFAQRLLSM